jgi:phosphatidylserine decarboxylase
MTKTKTKTKKNISWLKMSRNSKTKKIKKLNTLRKKEHTVIKKFKRMLEKYPVERQYMNTMISSIPKQSGDKQFKKHPLTLDELFKRLNDVLTVAPDFNKTILVGTPLSAILIWTLGSPEGFSAYRRIRINKMFGEVLAVYKKFLDSPESRYVLNKSKNGWLGKDALKKIDISQYQHDSTKPYYGFKSWNDFFTRKLNPGMRPIEQPNNNNVINSACDSTIYRISYNVKTHNKFWIKSQPYSLNAMLNGERKYVEKFGGGCVYQAFLNPFNYHRWHSPINGTIEKAYVKEGLYFTQDNDMKEDPTDQDLSEGYLTNVETRALIYIKADNPKIGTVCVMPVGMVEISSCNIGKNIKPGARVKKGDELGYFAFGGSTHCLIFEPNVIKKFKYKKNDFIKMGKIIAEVK